MRRFISLGLSWILLSLPLRAEVVSLQPGPSPADNPAKGLVPYASFSEEDKSRFPHSLEFQYLPLAQLMRDAARFDWGELETLLDRIAWRGNHAILRFWIEYPGKESGLPAFLKEQGVTITSWENPGDKTTSHTPDYEDVRVVSALESFIAALGKRYDGDPRIGGITAGLLGSWGEWHTYPREELFASPATQRRVLEAYERAFDATPVLLRYPVGTEDGRMAANAHYHMGYHDDSFAWATLEGRKGDDWFFMPSLKKAGDAALNKWRTQPIGGEVRPEIWGQIFDAQPAHPKAQDFAACVRQTHVSWLMETGMFREKAKPDRYAGALAHVQRMGYDFHVSRAEITRADTEFQVRLTVLNQGVAPFYQDWRMELGALSAEGMIAHRWPVDWKLTGLLPGEEGREWKASLTLPSQSLSGLTLGLRVIHPLPNGKPLRFANVEQDRHASGWLSLGVPAQLPERPTGPNADLGGALLMPPGDAWNRDISQEPVDPRSDAIIASIGADTGLHEDFGLVWNGAPGGIPYSVVRGDQPKVPVHFEYADESDPGPYPIPPDAPIEGGPQSEGDRHVLVLDQDHWKLYELFHAFPIDGGKSWKASSGAVFDLKAPKPRPAGWTSADAAGLPILPGLARYDEICGTQKLTHALRFTVKKTRRAYVPPATHFASPHQDENLPPMGMRVRLKADFDTRNFTGAARVILEGLKIHGMILADNGGDWFISGAPDDRWVHEDLLPIRKVKGRDLEVVKMGPMTTR